MPFEKGCIPWNKNLIGYGAGRIVSDETRKKISITNKGKKRTKETRKKLSIAKKGHISWNKGMKMSKEHCEKLSNSLKGRKLSEDHKRNISINNARFWKGKSLPPDTIRKSIETNKNNKYRLGKCHSVKTKEKISSKQMGNKYNVGKKHTEETKRKISISKTNPSLESRKNMRLAAIKRIQNNNGQIKPQYNYRACNFFEKLNKDLSLNGHHAENGGEHHIKELGYWLDYYEPNLNLVIEWDEKGHYDGNVLKEKDQLRQQEITEHLDCTFLRIRQNGNLNAQLNLITIYTEILQSRV